VAIYAAKVRSLDVDITFHGGRPRLLPIVDALCSRAQDHGPIFPHIKTLFFSACGRYAYVLPALVPPTLERFHLCPLDKQDADGGTIAIVLRTLQQSNLRALTKLHLSADGVKQSEYAEISDRMADLLPHLSHLEAVRAPMAIPPNAM
jgi:hypothetical protein